MSGSGTGPVFGTAYHPQPDPAFGNGRPGHGRPGQLPALPRRRRPAMIALSAALVGAGILASAALYQRADHQVPVVMVTAGVPSGGVITAGDVGTATVAAGPGVQLIPARQLQQVIGQVAGTALHPGMLLVASELTTRLPPGPGQQMVPVPVKPAILPASGLAAGDHVLVVATPGDQGQPGQTNFPPVFTTPIAGVVAAIDPATDSDGYDVVDLLVADSAGPLIAKQASTGQIYLVVTKRSP
jgi:hypothetical protein